MRKRGFFFWLVLMVVSSSFLFALFLFVLVRSFQPSVPSFSEGTTLTLDLAYGYPEEPLYDLSGPFFSVQSLTFRELLFAIDRAKTDHRVESLLIRSRGSALSWAKASELRAKLQEFRESAKTVVAFIEFASSRDYYVASVADEVFIHPRGMLHVSGIRAEMLFFGEGFEKLGVEPEFERIGAYKDAPDAFLRDSMSESSRESTGALVATIHDEMVAAVAKARDLSEEAALAAIAQGPLTAKQALDLGLVDGLEFLDEVDGEDDKRLDVQAFSHVSRGSGLPTFGADLRVAIIYGIGAIVPGPSGDDAMFGRVMGSDTIAEAFRTVREDDSIEAVVFRIDSPGGSDVASDIIWREASLTRESKPVIVSMGGAAASGGYWIATASDVIVADPMTITGSIGIYAGKFNLEGLFDKVGIGVDGISSTANADFFSSSRSFTPEERERLRGILRDGYDAFLRRVSDSRGMTTTEVDRIAQGRVWSGEKAQELGLVDELGGLSRAIELAKEHAGYESDASVELLIYPEKKSFFEAFLQSFNTSSSTASPSSTESLPLPVLERLDVEKLLERSPLARLVTRGAPLAMMPYRLRID